MDIEYLDGCIATVAEHKKNMIEAIRSYMTETNEQILEYTHTLEEVARFLNELNEEWQDNTEAYVYYGEGMNHFEIRKATGQERYSRWTERHNFSAREYFNVLRALTGKHDMSSYELTNTLKEDDYNFVMDLLDKE